MADELWKIVTPEQYKQGWIELRGVTPIHHQFQVIRKTEAGDYVVLDPESQIRRANRPEVSPGAGKSGMFDPVA